MVLAGQDAWRKHPLLYGLWKRPFPGLGTAAMLFGTYCVLEWCFTEGKTKPPATVRKIKFAQASIGEAPEGTKKGSKAHH